MPLITRPEEVRRVLLEARTIAVLGASPRPHRAGHYVPAYLAANGYHVLPVNPEAEARRLFGRPVAARLADLTDPVDVVDVFRRSEHLPDHLEDFLAMDPLPRVVWFQLGVRHDRVATALVEAGIDVVQDRCMLADHRTLVASRDG